MDKLFVYTVQLCSDSEDFIDPGIFNYLPSEGTHALEPESNVMGRLVSQN